MFLLIKDNCSTFNSLTQKQVSQLNVNELFSVDGRKQKTVVQTGSKDVSFELLGVIIVVHHGFVKL